ncbi:hypothetical protein [Amycolatopsis taiwanensis]|uniref:hypothetical protein n=1 Tax=Amycolatopsis taiwanensis TaxID=342230 RepID=UPI00146F9D66|nr:hypothetical protein [Amycolatopsis taiwanensis]
MTLMMGRPRQGAGGERARSVHLFTIRKTGREPDRLIALCGCRFHRPDVEFLGEVRGMPCEICLTRTPDLTGESSEGTAVLSDLHSFDRIEVLSSAVAAAGSAVGEAERQV